VAPPNGRIEQPLDAAAGQFERPIAGKGRRRLAGVDPGPAQHLHGERRGRARHEAADGVAGKLGAATAIQPLVPSAIRSSCHRDT
jgi:hypothetical protein